MPDVLESLDLLALRSACMDRGIFYPGGIPLTAACRHELISALRSPYYIEAFRLGIIGSGGNNA